MATMTKDLDQERSELEKQLAELERRKKAKEREALQAELLDLERRLPQLASESVEAIAKAAATVQDLERQIKERDENSLERRLLRARHAHHDIRDGTKEKQHAEKRIKELQAILGKPAEPITLLPEPQQIGAAPGLQSLRRTS